MWSKYTYVNGGNRYKCSICPGHPDHQCYATSNTIKIIDGLPIYNAVISCRVTGISGTPSLFSIYLLPYRYKDTIYHEGFSGWKYDELIRESLLCISIPQVKETYEGKVFMCHPDGEDGIRHLVGKYDIRRIK